MKPCSNPTCPYQVEDDARFCGMCGAYVGPEVTSHATLIDASAQRIQQCRDLLNSLQSEPDEKEKAQKIRTVINIVTSIKTNQLPSKPIALVEEQIQMLSAVVQKMITLPSISPTASAADVQHWPISPLEMRQWAELLITLIGSTNFSSLDEATRSAVRVALGRFISFIGIHARSNPDAEHLLLDLYESMAALSVPELQSCFSGVNKGKLFRRVEQRIQHSLSNASPSIMPVEVQAFGDLASEGLSLLEVGQQALEGKTRETIQTLGQIQLLGETDAPLTEAVVNAYVALLQKPRDNAYLQGRSILRLNAVVDLSRAALTMATIHFAHVPETVLALLNESLSNLIGNTSNLPRTLLIEAARTYIQLLSKSVSPEKGRLVGEFSVRNRGTLLHLDRSLARELDSIDI